jgi:site-specific recombinase
MFFTLANTLAVSIVNWFREWRAGPDTDETKAILAEVADKRTQIVNLEHEIEQLELLRMSRRTAAKQEQASWWKINRSQIAVNIVGSLIVSVPIFFAGVVVTLLVKG